jgi:transcriptional regulator with XRE-family HTH domain
LNCGDVAISFTCPTIAPEDAHMATRDALRALRTRAGLSQNALATAIGRSHTYIWNVEAGRVKLTARETIEVWAEALGVHPDKIYKAIGAVPHDIIDLLLGADLETWQSVRHLMARRAG